MSEQDSPWKEALERYLPSFLALYFPAVHAAIDWTRSYEWLNTELRQVVRDAELGTRLADVLVKVWRHDGEESWLLIHIEVQGWPETDFPRRMFVYHYRIFDRYNRQVVSLAVLADDRPNSCDRGFRQLGQLIPAASSRCFPFRTGRGKSGIRSNNHSNSGCGFDPKNRSAAVVPSLRSEP